MTFTFRPAVRVDTPLIIGIAGPTKSGKTYSAHRIARGLAGPDGVVAMINAEGPKGHQYTNKFSYQACEIGEPYTPERYTEALEAAAKLNPAVLIIDSISHMHDGPGGMLEYHDKELQRMGGSNRVTFSAWIKPKAAENQFIYKMLSLKCHVILCFRAKEKLKIVTGKEPIDLSWQPIAGERIAFETIFTLMIPPHSKGIPDMALSEMREPFDTMIEPGRVLDEALGAKLAAWAHGAAHDASEPPQAPAPRRQTVAAPPKPKEPPFGSEDWGDEPKPASSNVLTAFFERAKALGYSEAQVLSFAQVDSLDGATREDLQGIINDLKEASGQRQMVTN